MVPRFRSARGSLPDPRSQSTFPRRSVRPRATGRGILRGARRLVAREVRLPGGIMSRSSIRLLCFLVLAAGSAQAEEGPAGCERCEMRRLLPRLAAEAARPLPRSLLGRGDSVRGKRRIRRGWRGKSASQASAFGREDPGSDFRYGVPFPARGSTRPCPGRRRLPRIRGEVTGVPAPAITSSAATATRPGSPGRRTRTSRQRPPDSPPDISRRRPGR